MLSMRRAIYRCFRTKVLTTGLIAQHIQMKYKIISRCVGARHCRALTDVLGVKDNRRLDGGTEPNIFANLLGFTTFHPTYAAEGFSALIPSVLANGYFLLRHLPNLNSLILTTTYEDLAIRTKGHRRNLTGMP